MVLYHGDIVYSDDDAVNFPVTITAQAGSDGDSYKEGSINVTWTRLN